MRRSDIAQLLAQAPLFVGISHELLKRLASHIRPMRGGQGDRLFSEGDPSSGMFFVAEGVCDVSVSDDGVPLLIGELGPGQTFGEAALLLGGTRLVSVTARTEVVLFHLSIRAFGHLKAEDPDLGLRIVVACGKHLASTVQGRHVELKRLLIREARRA